MKEFFKGPAKRFYSSIFMRQILKKSSVIITPSHFTRGEILKYFNIDQKKIAVIHNGLDPHFYPRTINEQKTAQKTNGFPNSYLLYVGNIKRHKNITRLIQGYYKAWKQKSDLPKLFIVGQSDQGYDPYLEVISDFDEVDSDFENQVIFKGYVPYEDLPALYSGADVFIFPSLYEGFGFPPLEAMACGTPVIASNNSSLPEVLGDNALYVDPYDINQITSSILKIYENAEFVEPFINNGLKACTTIFFGKIPPKNILKYMTGLPPKKRKYFSLLINTGEYYGWWFNKIFKKN
jgi:Glycosyltransferase